MQMTIDSLHWSYSSLIQTSSKQIIKTYSCLASAQTRHDQLISRLDTIELPDAIDVTAA